MNVEPFWGSRGPWCSRGQDGLGTSCSSVDEEWHKHGHDNCENDDYNGQVSDDNDDYIVGDVLRRVVEKKPEGGRDSKLNMMTVIMMIWCQL